jgi:chromosome segregation ATPase
MAALTAEVRQLRVAVQELARSQAEAQALSIYMSAQQGRLSQATQQLDAARRELDAASARSQDAEARLTAYSNELPGTTDRERRAALEDAIRAVESERPEIDRAVQQARARESDASRRLSVEEDRWGDLLARLDELTN